MAERSTFLPRELIRRLRWLPEDPSGLPPGPAGPSGPAGAPGPPGPPGVATNFSSGLVTIATGLAPSGTVETPFSATLGPGKLWVMNRIECAMSPQTTGDVAQARLRLYRGDVFRDDDLDRPVYSSTVGVNGLLFEGVFPQNDNTMYLGPLVDMLSVTGTTIFGAIRVEGPQAAYNVQVETFGDLLEV